MLPGPNMRLAYFHHPDGPRPPEASPDDAREQETRDREEHPVLPHPEDRLGILPMPAVALDNVKEAPAMPLVLVRH